MAIAKRVSYASSSLSQTGVDVVAGELIEVNVVTYGALAPATIQDNAFGGTNAYLECGSGVAYSNSGHQLHKFYGIAKATETLQIDVTVAGTYPGIIVVIRNGNDTTLANVLVAYYNDASEGSSGTAHTSASATTVNADDFVSVLWAFNIGNSYLTENGAGFTEEQRRTASGFPSWANFGRSAATPGSYADVVTSSAANYAGNIVAVYKAAAAGVSGSGGTTQPVQTIAGAGTLPINGSGATSQPVQAISGTGTVGTPSGVTGSGGTTQLAQIIAGYGNTQAPAQGVPLVQAAMNGIFDGGRVKLERVFMPTWGDTSPGSVVLFEGNVAACEPSSAAVKLTIKSELERLNVALPKYLYQPSCGHVLYGPGCGISKAAWTVTGTVGSGATTTTLPSGRGEASGYFNLGVLVMTSGAALGARRSVRAFSGGAFTLALPLPVAPAPGDTFQVYPGCDHSLGVSGCARFSNQDRYRGFPNVPRPETAR